MVAAHRRETQIRSVPEVAHLLSHLDLSSGLLKPSYHVHGVHDPVLPSSKTVCAACNVIDIEYQVNTAFKASDQVGLILTYPATIA